MTTPTSAARARGWARAGEVGAREEIFLRGVVGDAGGLINLVRGKSAAS